MDILDLSNFPVVDAHCHSYLDTPAALTADQLARYASIAVQHNFLQPKCELGEEQISGSSLRLSTMYREQPFLKYLVHQLSKLFQCEDDLETVARKRSSKAQDFDTYVKALFENALVRGLVVDGGYPLQALTDRSARRIPAKVVKIFNLGAFSRELITRHVRFDEMYAEYESGIRRAIDREGYVGLKSIIAYSSGLRIQRVDFRDAMMQFEETNGKRERAELSFGPKLKKVYDFLFVRALELSIELDVPLQVHTGFGDYEIVLDQCDPALLFDLLKDEELRHATVVLLHSGFPRCETAAYIASVLPNVFLDFSLMIPFFNPTGYERLMEVLQLAPSSKIMYGSDGFNLPEMIWIGAHVAKKALGKCLSALVHGELFDAQEANRAARRILFENANALYKLQLA